MFCFAYLPGGTLNMSLLLKNNFCVEYIYAKKYLDSIRTRVYSAVI